MEDHYRIMVKERDGTWGKWTGTGTREQVLENYYANFDNKRYADNLFALVRMPDTQDPVMLLEPDPDKPCWWTIPDQCEVISVDG